MDARLGLTLQLTPITKKEHGKFKPKFETVPSVRQLQKKNEKKIEVGEEGHHILMKIPVKNGHPEFKSFLTSIAKL